MRQPKVELDKYVPWPHDSPTHITLDDFEPNRYHALAPRIEQLWWSGFGKDSNGDCYKQYLGLSWSLTKWFHAEERPHHPRDPLKQNNCGLELGFSAGIAAESARSWRKLSHCSRTPINWLRYTISLPTRSYILQWRDGDTCRCTWILPLPTHPRSELEQNWGQEGWLGYIEAIATRHAP